MFYWVSLVVSVGVTILNAMAASYFVTLASYFSGMAIGFAMAYSAFKVSIGRKAARRRKELWEKAQAETAQQSKVDHTISNLEANLRDRYGASQP